MVQQQLIVQQVLQPAMVQQHQQPVMQQSPQQSQPRAISVMMILMILTRMRMLMRMV
jgi:hypothetical protein